jgi:hypothetical protein
MFQIPIKIKEKDDRRNQKDGSFQHNLSNDTRIVQFKYKLRLKASLKHSWVTTFMRKTNFQSGMHVRVLNFLLKTFKHATLCGLLFYFSNL